MRDDPWLDASLAANGVPVRDNFQAWFGSSAAVNDQGQPLRLFHGSPFEIDRFRTGIRETTEGAAFFTADPDVAAQFATTALECGANDDEFAAEIIYPVFLSIQNPLVIAASEVMSENGHSFDAMKKAVARAKKSGHDGLRILQVPEFDGLPAADQWAAFSPSQIKSAVGNSGLYLKDSASLTNREEALALHKKDQAMRALAAFAPASKPKQAKGPA
jgi:hypothetical protein